jgi:hypothetical protein
MHYQSFCDRVKPKCKHCVWRTLHQSNRRLWKVFIYTIKYLDKSILWSINYHRNRDSVNRPLIQVKINKSTYIINILSILFQWCNPSVTTSAWTNRNGIPCDDGQKCTRSDTCKNGQCGGTSFQCNTLCQYCDGNGCSLNPGFGYVSGSCTCKIAGELSELNNHSISPGPSHKKSSPYIILK